MDCVDVKKTERAALGNALNRGSLELRNAPALTIPATAVMWLVYPEDTVKECACSDSLQQATQKATQHLGAGLYAAFDVVLPHNRSTDSQDAHAYMDSILSRMAHKAGQSGAAAVAGRLNAKQSNINNMQIGVLLRQRLAQSANLPVPCISPEALTMLQNYYALLRQQHQGHESDVSGISPGTYTLASLVRMASASARLHMRQGVNAMPDAVLAIYLLQQSMKAKVRSSVCADMSFYPWPVHKPGAC